MMPPIFNRSLSILLLLLAIITHQGLGKSQAHSAYDLSSVQAEATDPTINVYTSYTITIDRTVDSSGTTAPWSTSPVPAGSNITIMFPAQFNMSVGYTCPVPMLCNCRHIQHATSAIVISSFPTHSLPSPTPTTLLLQSTEC